MSCFRDDMPILGRKSIGFPQPWEIPIKYKKPLKAVWPDCKAVT